MVKTNLSLLILDHTAKQYLRDLKCVEIEFLLLFIQCYVIFTSFIQLMVFQIPKKEEFGISKLKTTRTYFQVLFLKYKICVFFYKIAGCKPFHHSPIFHEIFTVKFSHSIIITICSGLMQVSEPTSIIRHIFIKGHFGHVYKHV